MKTRKQIAELAAILAFRTNTNKQPKNPYWISTDVLLLSRIAATADRLAVALCNGEIEQRPFDDKRERLLKRIEHLGIRYSVRFEIGGDPRGYVLKMHGKDLHGSTWGGDESEYGI